MRRAAISLLLVVVLAPAATAHATPDETTPRAGSRVDEGAQLVRVTFSEPLVDALSCIEARSGGDLLARSCSLPPGELRALQVVAPGIAGGVVDVSWRVLGLDGHVREGGFAYAVGTSAASSSIRIDAAPSQPRLLGGALAVGGVLALGLPAFSRRTDARVAASRAGALAALVASGAAIILLVSTSDALGVGVGALASTFPGGALALDAALLALAGALLLARHAEGGAFAAGAALGIGVLTSHAIVGGGGAFHAAHIGLVVIAAHVGAAAVWAGAVGGLLLARRDDDASVAWRARTWARGGVVVLAVSGVGLALLTSLDPRVFVSGAFGRLFAAKLALFVGALILGLLHERRYRRDAPPSRGAIAIEALLLTAALVAGGALAATPA